MKSFIKLSIIIATTLFLVSCGNNNTNITASFAIEESSLQTTSVIINVNVDDPQSEITGNIIFTLRDSDGKVIYEQDYASVEDASLISYTQLIQNTTYTVTVSAAVGRSSFTIDTFTFTTLAETDLEITTVEEFLAMNLNRGGDYVLMNDLDFSDVEFVTPFTSSFTGTFEGNGYTLRNITITESRLYNGVFGYVSSATISNVKLDNISIGTEEAPIETSSSTKTGILVGYQSSSLSVINNIEITNSAIYLNSSSSTYAYIGGIVGEVRGTLEQVTLDNVYVQVKTSSYATARIGGAVGYVYESGKARELSVQADVNFRVLATLTTLSERSFNIYVGGLFGDADPGSTSNSEAYGLLYIGEVNIDALNFNPNEGHDGVYSVFVGGLFGVMNRSFYDVYADATVSLNYVEESVETNVNKYVRVGVLAGSVNTYDLPEQVVLFEGSLQLDVPESVNLLVSEGVAKALVMPTIYTLNGVEIIINETPYEANDLTVITTFDELFTNEFLLGAISSIIVD